MIDLANCIAIEIDHLRTFGRIEQFRVQRTSVGRTIAQDRIHRLCQFVTVPAAAASGWVKG